MRLCLVLVLLPSLLPQLGAQEIEGRFRYQLPTAEDTLRIIKKFRQAESLKKTEPDSARILYEQILQDSRHNSFERGVLYALYQIAGFYTAEGAYDKSLTTYREALSLAQRLGNHTMTVSLLVSHAIPHMYSGQYDSSILYAYKALDEMKKHEVPGKEQAVVYNTVGSMWLRMSEPRQALNYLRTAEHTALINNDVTGLINIRSNIGGAYLLLDILDTAEIYLKQVITTETRFHTGAPAVARINLGTIYLRRNQPEKALKLFQNALEHQHNEEFYTIISARHGLGEAHFRLKNYQQAEEILLSVIESYDETNTRDKIEAIYHTLAALHAETGRYESAYHYQKLYENSFTELFEREKIRLAGQMEARYQNSEKDRALTSSKLLIAQRESRIKGQNLWIAGATGGILLLGALLLGLYRSNRHKQHIQSEKIRNLQQQQEIEKLKAIMEGEEKERNRIAYELHDGVGSQHSAMMLYLHSLQNKYEDTGITKELQQVIRLLKETADDLRSTAHNLMPESLQQQGLEMTVKSFCERMSKNRSLTLDFFSYGDLNQLEKSFALILYRMIQELVQNVVKHASATRLSMMLTLINNRLSVSVEDDGVGILVTESDGMGLSTLKSRVQALDGELIIETEPQRGTTVSITFPNVKLLGNDTK